MTLSILAGWALIFSSIGYGVKFWLSARSLGAWPSACSGLRLLWLMMVAGCLVRGVQLVRGTDTVHGYGGPLILLIFVVAMAEALAVIKAGRIHMARQHAHLHRA